MTVMSLPTLSDQITPPVRRHQLSNQGQGAPHRNIDASVMMEAVPWCRGLAAAWLPTHGPLTAHHATSSTPCVDKEHCIALHAPLTGRVKRITATKQPVQGPQALLHSDPAPHKTTHTSRIDDILTRHSLCHTLSAHAKAENYATALEAVAVTGGDNSDHSPLHTCLPCPVPLCDCSPPERVPHSPTKHVPHLVRGNGSPYPVDTVRTYLANVRSRRPAASTLNPAHPNLSPPPVNTNLHDDA